MNCMSVANFNWITRF